MLRHSHFVCHVFWGNGSYHGVCIKKLLKLDSRNAKFGHPVKKKRRLECFRNYEIWHTFTLLAICFSTRWIWRWGLFHWKVDFKSFNLSTNLTQFRVRTASKMHFEVGTNCCQVHTGLPLGSSVWATGLPVRGTGLPMEHQNATKFIREWPDYQ